MKPETALSLISDLYEANANLTHLLKTANDQTAKANGEIDRLNKVIEDMTAPKLKIDLNTADETTKDVAHAYHAVKRGDPVPPLHREQYEFVPPYKLSPENGCWYDANGHIVGKIPNGNCAVSEVAGGGGNSGDKIVHTNGIGAANGGKAFQ